MTRITKAEYDASLAAAYNLGRSDATATTGGTYATPVVRGLARTLGVDLAKVKGTGVAGRITPKDVRATAPRRATPAAVADDAYPAHWDRSPLGDDDAAKAESSTSAPASTAGRDAGIAYPANWAR